MTKYLSHSEKETMKIAARFAKQLKPGSVVALEGTLGSGKTTFIKGMAAGLGLKDSGEVKSPTFVLMHIYPACIPLYHFDLYRLEGKKEIEGIGLDEFIHDPKAITCVEWAEKAGELLPDSAHHILFQVTGKRTRRIQFSKRQAKLRNET